MLKTLKLQVKKSNQFVLKVFNLRMLILLFAFFVYGCEKSELNSDITPNGQKLKATQILAVTANNTPCYWADLLIQNVSEANNIYSTLNSGDLVSWAGVNGALTYNCKTDCSGLIKNLLKQTYGYTDTYFKSWTGLTNPFASTFYNEIKAKDHFSQVSTVTSIIRGDIIAIKYPSTSTNTGHIMLVASAPILRTSTSPLISSTKQYEVSVLDASSSGHGSFDTRYISTGNFNDGIGRGIFRLYANSKGAIVGYSWSTYSTSDYYSQSARPLIVGRLIP